jgi:tetratricopeptide (TPR) repeat protein
MTFLTAKCFYHLGKTDSALQFLERCHEENAEKYEQDYEYWMLSGDSHFLMGKYAVALSEYKNVR